jgi:SPP1 gp7 family putative phage head morphogenesis protein
LKRSKIAVNGFEQRRYTDFIKARDRALEDMLTRAQARIALTLDDVFDSIRKQAPYFYQQKLRFPYDRRVTQSFAQFVDMRLADAFVPILSIYSRLITSTKILSFAGEAEALGRLRQKQKTTRVPESPLSMVTSDGKRLPSYVEYLLSRLKTKITQSFELSALSEETMDAFGERLERAFPKRREKRRRGLTRPSPKLLEVGKKATQNFTVFQVDDDDWRGIVDEVMGKITDFDRALGKSRRLAPAVSEELFDQVVAYEWELEKLVTEEFVQAVREGQVEAAKEMGVKDFIWIAVLDDRTDECCAKRDGLLVSEIKERLSTEWQDDDCAAHVPPAHPNCRCTIAPVLTEEPVSEGISTKDFDEWLLTGTRPQQTA